MDSPFGHNNRHHHTSHRREEDEDRRPENYPPPNFQQPPPPYSGGGGGFVHEPPPPYSGGGGFVHEPPPPYSGGGGGFVHEPPPPFQGGGGYVNEPPPPSFSSVTHHRHEPPPPQFSSNYGGGGEYGYGHNPPPPQPNRYEYDDTPPPPTHVQHVSHEVGHHHRPGPATPEYGGHETGSGGGGYGFASNRPSVRIFSKAETNYSLTIRNGQVVLAPADPRDEYQHWIKDEKWSTKVKDGEGHPSFSLVNKATGQAIKHSVAATQPVQLVPYDQNAFDESVLWAESKDLGDTYRCIRMVNNIKLNLDAFNGDKEHGGVHDGTVAVLWEWKKGDNQRWKIVPY